MSYAPPPVPPAPSGPAPQWGPPPGVGAYGPPRTDGMAIAALILAIVSFVFCPMIAAIVALALAHAAGNRIDASRGQLGGAGIVRAAQIVAWVHIGLVTVGTLIAAVALAVAESNGTF